MTGGCWGAHPTASNMAATINDRNFTLRSLAPLTGGCPDCCGRMPGPATELNDEVLQRSCPKCNGYLVIVVPVEAINGRCLNVVIGLRGCWFEGNVSILRDLF